MNEKLQLQDVFDELGVDYVVHEALSVVHTRQKLPKEYAIRAASELIIGMDMYFFFDREGRFLGYFDFNDKNARFVERKEK